MKLEPAARMLIGALWITPDDLLEELIQEPAPWLAVLANSIQSNSSEISFHEIKLENIGRCLGADLNHVCLCLVLSRNRLCF